jgi:hypothetical protein
MSIVSQAETTKWAHMFPSPFPPKKSFSDWLNSTGYWRFPVVAGAAGSGLHESLAHFGLILSSSMCWMFSLLMGFSDRIGLLLHTPTHLDKNISAATIFFCSRLRVKIRNIGDLFWSLHAQKFCAAKVEENGWAQLSNISSCLMMFIAHRNRHESTLIWKSHCVNWWLTIVRFLKEKVHTTVKNLPFKFHYYEVSFWKGEK